VADYDVRHVVGHGPKAVLVSDETVSPPPSNNRQRKPAVKSAMAQTSIEFVPAPQKLADDKEGE
jgi:hypothetical protein